MFHSKKKATSKNRSKWIYDERWFINRMKKSFQAIVPIKEVTYEALSFTHEEIDDSLISVEHLKKLPNPLLLQYYLYVDQKDIEWIAGIVIDEKTGKLLYEIWLKEGKAIAYEIYAD